MRKYRKWAIAIVIASLIFAVSGLAVLYLGSISVSTELKPVEVEEVSDQIVIVRVEDNCIYANDINQVYDSIYGHLEYSPARSAELKKEILENGINEIVALYECQTRGIPIDTASSSALAEQLKVESPSIYELIENQMGLERYIEDLAKSNAIRELKQQVLCDFVIPDISDEELYVWYCDQLAQDGQNTNVLYEDFMDNRDMVYYSWVDEASENFFNQWVYKKRENYKIEYISPVE